MSDLKGLGAYSTEIESCKISVVIAVSNSVVVEKCSELDFKCQCIVPILPS